MTFNGDIKNHQKKETIAQLRAASTIDCPLHRTPCTSRSQDKATLTGICGAMDTFEWFGKQTEQVMRVHSPLSLLHPKSSESKSMPQSTTKRILPLSASHVIVLDMHLQMLDPSRISKARRIRLVRLAFRSLLPYLRPERRCFLHIEQEGRYNQEGPDYLAITTHRAYLASVVSRLTNQDREMPSAQSTETILQAQRKIDRERDKEKE